MNNLINEAKNIDEEIDLLIDNYVTDLGKRNYNAQYDSLVSTLNDSLSQSIKSLNQSLDKLKELTKKHGTHENAQKRFKNYFLKEREVNIFKQYYLEGKTFKEIGEIYNISGSRAVNIRNDVMTKIRRHLEYYGEIKSEVPIDGLEEIYLKHKRL